MDLNMADLGKCRKSLQTSWNASYELWKGFLTTCKIVHVYCEWIRKVPKLAEFEQKPRALTQGFLVMADLGKCRKSLQTPWNASCELANGYVTTWDIFHVYLGWKRKVPKLAEF